ncbi:MAG: TetR family transcriptional regulator [Alphaproteobacteria bacterium]|nr:TetR family transcriptional regulator [Alphaproteobacteria bacterium]
MATTDARARILEAASRLFAERGFGETTVRDIIFRANVNIAAVNYYFGSKEALYVATIERALNAVSLNPGMRPASLPEESRIMWTLLSRMLAWEIAKPSGALGQAARTAIDKGLASLREYIAARSEAGKGSAAIEMAAEASLVAALFAYPLFGKVEMRAEAGVPLAFAPLEVPVAAAANEAVPETTCLANDPI